MWHLDKDMTEATMNERGSFIVSALGGEMTCNCIEAASRWSVCRGSSLVAVLHGVVWPLLQHQLQGSKYETHN